jgi:hypothetical protein
MATPTFQDQRAVNKLGQDLFITLNSGTRIGGNPYSNAGSITPSIKNMKYFRAISNVCAEVYCSFAKTSYVLLADGTLQQNKNILIGYDDVWYETDNKDINSADVQVIWPTSVFDSVSICFQFVPDVPPELRFE